MVFLHLSKVMDYKGLAAGLISGCEENCADCEYAGDSEFECTIAQLAATAITDLLARAEAAEARAEKAEIEKHEAISDLETIMAYGEADLDTCEFCKNGQCYERGGTKPCLPKWRGQKEE